MFVTVVMVWHHWLFPTVLSSCYKPDVSTEKNGPTGGQKCLLLELIGSWQFPKNKQKKPALRYRSLFYKQHAPTGIIKQKRVSMGLYFIVFLPCFHFFSILTVRRFCSIFLGWIDWIIIHNNLEQRSKRDIIWPQQSLQKENRFAFIGPTDLMPRNTHQ